MLPIKFQFVALSAATQLKGELYKFKPARTKPSPDWTSENGVMNAPDIHAPYTDPSFWTDRYAMATLTMEKPKGGQLVINDAIVNISRRKNIVTTQLVGMNGTVKEYVGMGDYDIRIAVGIQAKKDGVLTDDYPKEGLEELRDYLLINEAIDVQSTFLDIFDINKIVITDFGCTQATDSNYQELSISALSDEDYNVFSTEY